MENAFSVISTIVMIVCLAWCFGLLIFAAIKKITYKRKKKKTEDEILNDENGETDK